MREDIALNPKDDGITHINVYSRSLSELGFMLSNFYHAPFECEDGKFASVEGYWYWLGCNDERLRSVYGWKAKELGRAIGGPDWIEGAEFKRKIATAMRIKITSHPKIANLLRTSTLPFAHYYVYYSKVVPVPEADWVLDELEAIRTEMKNAQA